MIAFYPFVGIQAEQTKLMQYNYFYWQMTIKKSKNNANYKIIKLNNI